MKTYDTKSEYCAFCKKTRLVKAGCCKKKQKNNINRWKCSTCGRIFIKQ